jgi:hypothetical protein
VGCAHRQASMPRQRGLSASATPRKAVSGLVRDAGTHALASVHSWTKKCRPPPHRGAISGREGGYRSPWQRRGMRPTCGAWQSSEDEAAWSEMQILYSRLYQATSEASFIAINSYAVQPSIITSSVQHTRTPCVYVCMYIRHSKELISIRSQAFVPYSFARK